MEDIWKENKGMIFIWIVTIVISSTLLLFLKCAAMNNIVQAMAIITLVFVTWFYAKQTKRQAEETKRQAEATKMQAEETKRLVEENKKKNEVDFWERRLDEFYTPFLKKINTMKDKLHADIKDFDGLYKLIHNTYYLFWGKRRMTSKKTAQKISNLMQDTYIAGGHRREKDFERYYEIEREVRKIIVREMDDIEDKIREFYGY